ncbi:class A beta-lactamase-related serine hydrolase (plasmid) [Streptomyces sp. BHT-5-2]|uniref:serine hydrolase n=1 Tax=Streptomyces sp. BHT-5-2 TaxID=2866715 RepID=UPI001C8D4576|nr:serine hydrolase [Streptomyces sp. BHT-5-2]QZL08636.1 class A beta-lactamase-related serine hydrolase [Streptomyces sp. BHT-5-2]
MHGSPSTRRTRRGLAALIAAGAALTVCGAAPPASASTGSDTVGGAEVVCTSDRPDLALTLSHDLAGALQGRQGTSAVALYDRTSGTSCTLQADTHFDSASVVKVAVLGALLRQTEEAHRALTAHEVALTTAMITKSDNASTDALWHQVRRSGVQHFLDLAGMRNTVPGPGGAWGLTQITAADQLTLMRLLASDNDALDPTSRAYALDLMRRVVPEQRWGVPAGAPASATAYLKNGWLPRADQGWRVHSVGSFTDSGNDYSMAVLSSGSDTMDHGVATVEAAAKVIHRDLAAGGR